MRSSATFCVSATLAISMALAQHPSVSDSSEIPHAKIDSIFRQWDSPNSPGCALGIIWNGKLVFLRGYGMADLKNHIPISPTTIFNLASLSKQFTAASLVLLAQEGKLSLDDDVRTYIPELPDYGKPITIRRLLDHTSGIRDYIQMMFLAGSRHASVVTNADALKMIVRQKALNFPPGDDHLYSNSGYVLAGSIVERVTGESLAKFEHDHIFGPLGMTHTRIVNDYKKIIAGDAAGYQPNAKKGFDQMLTHWEDTGDGNIHSTVEDLYLWDQNFYNPTVGGKAMIDQLTTPGRLNDSTQLHYAFGLGVWEYKGLKVVNHEGEWAGYRTEFMRFPGQKFSVIILCNLSTMVPEQLAERIADICLAPEIKEALRAAPIASGPVQTVVLPPDSLPRYVGRYRNTAGELIREIAVRNGRLRYVRGPNSATDLIPIGNDRFSMKGVPVETDVEFNLSSSGGVTGMRVVSEGMKPIAFEPFLQVVPTAGQLREYTGIYHSDELNVDYRFLVHDSSLWMHTTDSDDDKLLPTVRDVFKIQDVGIVKFSRTGDAITGFSFTFGRVRNIAFVRKLTEAHSQAGPHRKDKS